MGLDSEETYRIRVLAGGIELGFADVDVVSSGKELKNVDTDEYVALKDGRTLPIKFRVEEGAIGQVGAGGGQAELAGGDVMLDIPAGAVGGPIAVAAVPVTDPSMLPPSPTPIPGTVFDLQPDGTAFAELITLTIAYDPALLPPGVPEEELRIHKLVNGEYVQLDAGVVDLVNKTVSGVTDGFSIYVLLQRLFPGSPEDITPPRADMLTVRDPQSGTFGAGAAIDVSAGDETVTVRISGTDDISGVSGAFGFDIRFLGPSGRIFPSARCRGNPVLGSDTNGEWECDLIFPQYSEPGPWQGSRVFVADNLGNFDTYEVSGSTLCTAGGDCMTPPIPVVVVSSNPFDVTPPEIVAAGFGLPSDPTPTISDNVAVDVTAGAAPLMMRFHVIDDLSGGSLQPLGGFAAGAVRTAAIASPSGAQGQNCFPFTLVQGTPTDGIWECEVTIPEFSEPGLWTYTGVSVRDRVRNRQDYSTDGAGQLCLQSGPCVSNATVDLASIPDVQGPFLSLFQLNVVDATVTVTMNVTDDLSGATTVRPGFLSANTQQFQLCTGSLLSGDALNGTWECSFTLPQFSATGPWPLAGLQLRDGAGNRRDYTRRASDGFLCYDDGAGGQVCQDFGNTEFVVQ